MSRRAYNDKYKMLSPLITIILGLLLLPFLGLKLMASGRIGLQILGGVLLVIGVAFWLALAFG